MPFSPVLFSKVLVALDGSLTAEAALGFLGTVLAGGPQDEVVLATVVETTTDANVDAARAYLERTCAEFERGWSGPTETAPLCHVQAVGVEISEPGRPPSKRRIAETIVETADQAGADLIVLTSNGWSGTDRWLLGSVAERVVQSAQTSVFLVRADDRRDAGPVVLNSVLVPLDGSDTAEQALPYASAIAARAGAPEATVVHVRLPKDGAANRIMRPTYDFRPFPKGDEEHYLAGVAQGLATEAMRVGTALRDGDPGPQINEEARESRARLIVMASHGRTSASARAYGKVADDVLHAAPVPVLMVRTAE